MAHIRIGNVWEYPAPGGRVHVLSMPCLKTYKKFMGSNKYLISIECFHSRGQHVCKFTGTKERVCIIKEFNSNRTGLGHQHGRPFIVLGHQYGRRDVMWKHSIERFHSRGHHLCKFIETKENFCLRKESNSHRIGLGHQKWPPFHCFVTPIWPPWRHYSLVSCIKTTAYL